MIPIGISLATFGVRYTELHAAAQALDALGYDSIWLWDHYTMSQWRFRDNFPSILAALDAALAEAGRSRAAFELDELEG